MYQQNVLLEHGFSYIFGYIQSGFPKYLHRLYKNKRKNIVPFTCSKLSGSQIWIQLLC